MFTFCSFFQEIVSDALRLYEAITAQANEHLREVSQEMHVTGKNTDSHGAVCEKKGDKPI